MSRKITTAVFPVAGMGTRFLPATKTIPKEILTLVDRPLVQYAMDEAREAGITDFIFVTARGKAALENYFDVNCPVEEALSRAGKTELLQLVQQTNLGGGQVAYVRQHEALGLGHAVWCARRLVGDAPFAVILPDDVMVGTPGCLAQMVAAHAEFGGTILATIEVAPEQTSSYGVVDVARTEGAVMHLNGVVEKPRPGTAPSNHAVIGRYILQPEILKHLDRHDIGAGGEVQLTDAIAREMRENPGSVIGLQVSGQRFDCGSKAGMLQATVALALARDDLRDEFVDFLHGCLPQSRMGAADALPPAAMGTAAE